MIKSEKQPKGKPYFMEINNRINDMIEDGDITRSELAEKIGVTRKQITRWTSHNGQEMGIYKLKAMCELYQVSADYILGLPKGLNWPREPKGEGK